MSTAALAADLRERAPSLNVFTADEFAGNNLDEMRTGLLPILATVAIFGGAVGAAVLTLLLYGSILERREDYALLKAIGASRSFLMRLVFRQCLTAVIWGFGFGLAHICLDETGADAVRADSHYLALVAGRHAHRPRRHRHGAAQRLVAAQPSRADLSWGGVSRMIPGSVVARVTGVSKTFSTAGVEPVVAVRDASLELRGGEVTLISGASGSGKTTLLSIIGGLIPPSSGEVELAGRAIELCCPRRS